MQPLTEKIDKIVTDLGDTKEDVLALTEEVCQNLWQQINRTDAESIRTGSERMIVAVTAVTAFQKASEDLVAKLRGLLPAPPVAPAQAAQLGQRDKQLECFADKPKITLRDSWTYRRPFGFILRGKPYPWKYEWINVYYQLACALRDTDPKLFETLPDRSEFTSSQGNPYISRERTQLRIPMKLSETIFAESNLNANLISSNIFQLLQVFSVPESEVEFYLRK